MNTMHAPNPERHAAPRRRPGQAVALAVTALSLAVVGVLALAGTATTAGAAGSSTTKAEVARAKKDLIVLKDLPKGWKSSPSSNSNSTFPGAAQLAACIGVPAGIINDNPPSANSPDFASANQLMTVDDSIAVSPSVKAARADYDSLTNARTPSCLTTVLNGPAKATLTASFGTGATIGTIDVTRSPSSDFAGHGANFTAFLPVTVQTAGQTETLNVQLTVVDYRLGTENETLTLSSIQSPFPTALAKHLTAVAVHRF